MITSFKKILKEKAGHRFDSWLEEVQTAKIPGVQNFATGIKRDLDAAKNGISMPFSNGLAEGTINKLEVIKRIMYGRSSFNTLKHKLLHLQRWF